MGQWWAPVAEKARLPIHFKRIGLAGMRKLAPLLTALAVVAGVALLAFPPRNEMRQAVRDFGFDPARLTGFAWLGCSEQDVFRQKWVGRNPAGRAVSGVVCGGITKGWTVRMTDRRVS